MEMMKKMQIAERSMHPTINTPRRMSESNSENSINLLGSVMLVTIGFVFVCSTEELSYGISESLVSPSLACTRLSKKMLLLSFF